MLDLPWYIKYLSFLLPVTLARHKSPQHPNLKIKYYRRQWQLESQDALYSDGQRYAPFRLGFNYLDKQKKLRQIKNFLLLGGGLGSALSRLQTKYKLYPETTLVEYDEKIIELAKSYLNLNEKKNVQFVNIDAIEFIKKSNTRFDLIGIDLFEGLTNSKLIWQDAFLTEVRNSLKNDGSIIFNSIFSDRRERKKYEKKLEQFFSFKRLDRNPNYIYILQIKK